MNVIKIEVKNNKFLNERFLIDKILNLEDGIYNIFIEKAEVGQAKYFFYRDVIADYLGYGTVKEKKELHEYIKRELLPEIFKEPENLNVEDYNTITRYSTTYLSPRGFHELNKSLSLWAMLKFEIKLE